MYSCRPNVWPFYFGIILPLGVIYLINWTVFFIIMYSLTKQFHGNRKRIETETRTYQKLVYIAFSLSVMFGLGWIFAFLVPIPQEEVSTIAQYIFSIVFGLHGALLFILHGIRSADARDEWKRWFYKIFCCRRVKSKHLYHTTGTMRRRNYTSGENVESETRRNPVYQPHDDTFTETTSPTFVSPYDTTPRRLKRGSDSEPDIGSSLDALSFASQTLVMEFGEGTTDEEGRSNIDLSELTTIMTSSFPITPHSGIVVISNVDHGPSLHEFVYTSPSDDTTESEPSDEHYLSYIEQ